MVVALITALAATLQGRPCPMSLPWLILTFFLSRILSPPPTITKGSCETKFDLVTFLLTTSRWLPMALKFQISERDFQGPGREHAFLPSTSDPQLHRLCQLLLSLQFSASHHLLQEDRLSPLSLRIPRPVLAPKTPQLSLSLHICVFCCRL